MQRLLCTAITLLLPEAYFMSYVPSHSSQRSLKSNACHEAMARYMPLPRVPHVPGVISTATVPAGE